MAEKKYAIGVDYGTNSVRALLVDISNGRELATHVFSYPQGRDGIILEAKDPHVARQHPADYEKGLEVTVSRVLKKAGKIKGFSPSCVTGIGVDTTGSTPIPVDESGTPLAYKKEFRKNKNALAWLWKDHSSAREASDITELAKEEFPQYLCKCGGTYSSEWFFSKILHCLRTDKKVFDAAYSWVEFCDYIPALLTGDVKPENIKRSICTAGHKAMYNGEYGGLPSAEFLGRLHPDLAALRARLYDKAYPADVKTGTLSAKYAKLFGLSTDVAVSAGALDAHMGAVGSGIKPGSMVKILGTSGCDMMVAPKSSELKDIPGLCGIVDSSILPGYWGLEAGQSAVGDILHWFVDNFSLSKVYGKDPHVQLTKLMGRMKPGETGLMTLDWHNGNRTILVDPRLTGMTMGFTLGTKPEHIYRSLTEGIAFGAKVIINRFEEYGVRVNDIICCGGIADKNPVFMQIYADILGRELKVVRSGQTCALGAAMFGAAAAGAGKMEDLQKNMCGIKKTYRPIKDNVIAYERIYSIYRKLHDLFGTKDASYNMYDVMKNLLSLKPR